MVLDGRAVPGVCNQAMNFLLESLEDHLETTKLSAASEGKLVFLRFNDLSLDPWLAFVDNNNEAYGLMKVPVSVGSLYGRMFVRGNQIFSIESIYNNQKIPTNSDRIIASDPFQLTTEIIFDSDTVGGGYISSFYMVKDSIYLLMEGDDFRQCMDSYTICKGDIYKINLVTKETEKVSSSVMGRKIHTVDTGAGFIYLTNGTGDAGCSFWVITSISLLDKSEKILFEDGSCDGDSDWEMVNQTRVNILNTTANEKIETNYLGVRKGALVPIDLEDGFQEGSFVFLP